MRCIKARHSLWSGSMTSIRKIIEELFSSFECQAGFKVFTVEKRRSLPHLKDTICMREMTNLKSTVPRDGRISCLSVASTAHP
jgi:hypothetical protein